MHALQAKGASGKSLVEESWHILLNALNSMDAVLHIAYGWTLLRLMIIR